MDRWHQLESLKSGDGVTEDRLDAVQKAVKRALPDDLVDLYRHMNGFEGVVGACYLAVFSVEDLVEERPLGFIDGAPDIGAWVVGSNGGGEWLIYVFSGIAPGLYLFPKISTDVEDLVFLAPTLLDVIDGCLAGRVWW